MNDKLTSSVFISTVRRPQIALVLKGKSCFQDICSPFPSNGATVRGANWGFSVRNRNWF